MFFFKKRKSVFIFALLFFSIFWILFSPFVQKKIYPFSYFVDWKYDRYIPLVPFFVIFYLSFIPFIYFSIFRYKALSSREKYANTLTFFTLSFLFIVISFVFYFIYPFSINRPHIGSGFFNSLIDFVYSYDLPVGLMPSQHVGLTFFTILFFAGNSFFMIFFGIMIILSTLFIKQHFIIDLILAIIIDLILYISLKNYFYNFFYKIYDKLS